MRNRLPRMVAALSPPSPTGRNSTEAEMPIDPKQLLKDQSFLSASPDEQSQYVSSFDPDFAKASREDQAAYLSHVTGKPTSFGISAGNGAPPMPKAPYQKMQMEEDTGPTTVKEAIDQTLAKNPANFTGKRALDLATNPIVDPEVYKTLGRGAVSTGEMIGGMPSAIYHAFKDKATPEEMQKSPSVYGGNSFRKGLRRLSGVDAMDVAEAAYRDKNSGAFGNIDSVPKVTPESALEVAPEAIGQGAGTVIAGKLTDIGMNIPKVVADATAPARNALAQKIVSPMTFENVGETAADVRTGTDPARGIVDEGLVGTKKGLAGAPNKPGKIDARLGELKSSADNILQNHPNSRQLIDAEPIIDSAIDKAIGETQKIAGSTSRLEELRTALKTKYGKTQGTPYEINNLKTDIQKAASDLGAYKNTQPIEASIARAMGDTANRLKNAVNEKVPEAADLNQRMSDLIDAKAGITRKVNAAKGEDLFGGHTGITGKVAQRVLGNAPVRTGIARVLNAGNVKGVPSSQNYIPPQIRGLLPSAPIELGSEMEPIGEPSQTGRPPIPGEAENVTRAERKGLLLPERAGMSRPIQMGSEMEPIGQPSTPQSELPYRPSLQQPPAFVAPGQIKPAGPPQDLLFPNE